MPLIGIITAGINLLGGWIKHKQEMAAARQQAELEWASKMADASSTSWKDEYTLLVWTLPLVFAIFGWSAPLENLIRIVDTAPQWMTGLWVTLSLASFGLSAKGKWENIQSKRDYNRNGNGNGNGQEAPNYPKDPTEGG